MSKLFEALQEAKREKASTASFDVSQSLSGGGTSTFNLEREMINLYRSLEVNFPTLTQKVICFLGANEGDGTSTIVASLARIVAGCTKLRVAVLDMDTRHPTQCSLLGVTPKMGWNETTSGKESVQNALHQTSIERLSVVSGSLIESGVHQVIDRSAMKALLEGLFESVDLILIDCAPNAQSADGIALSGDADGTVLIIQAEYTRWPEVQKIQHEVKGVGGRVIGAVLNKRRF